jgi:hypothetical protein
VTAYKAFLGSALVSLLGVTATAHARPGVGSLNSDGFDLSGALDREVAPPPFGLEVAVGGGYTQGVGGAGGSGSVEDLTGPGGGLELQVGTRLRPELSLALYGTLARFQHGDAIADGARAHAATAGIQAAWHARQSRSLDPWIGVGLGWRALRLEPMDAPASTLQGGELRLQLGIDYRFSRRLAISPVIGASLAMFLAETSAMASGLSSVADHRINFYGFTGVLGRFDVGG